MSAPSARRAATRRCPRPPRPADTNIKVAERHTGFAGRRHADHRHRRAAETRTIQTVGTAGRGRARRDADRAARRGTAQRRRRPHAGHRDHARHAAGRGARAGRRHPRARHRHHDHARRWPPRTPPAPRSRRPARASRWPRRWPRRTPRARRSSARCRPSSAARPTTRSSRARARRCGPRRCCASRSRVAPVSEHGAVVSARVYSSGLAWNEMTLNGTRTSERTFLDPGFTSYDKTVLYTTDDVTGLIRQNASTRGRERDRLAARLRAVRQRDDVGRLGLVDGRVAHEPDAAHRPLREVRGRHRAGDQVRRLVADERRGPDPLRQPLPRRDVRRPPRAAGLGHGELRRGAAGRRARDGQRAGGHAHGAAERAHEPDRELPGGHGAPSRSRASTCGTPASSAPAGGP